MSDPQWWLLDDLVLARQAVDRAAVRRTDRTWLAEALHDSRSRFVYLHGGCALVSGSDLVTRDMGVAGTAPSSLLGVDQEGRAYFGIHLVDRNDLVVPDAQWSDLRSCGDGLSAADAGLMVTGVALDNWSRAHNVCSGCGGRLSWQEAGWSRRCEVDGLVQFPRTDPAVICLVRDDDDRALLGRQVRWETNWYSTLAGFVEAGESAEAAVRREVAEESGVLIGQGTDSLLYLGSQPWPFPGSLMLGYHAWASHTDVQVDGDEIADARWFTRDELVLACEAGEVSLPPAVSIARKLIERWFGRRLPGDWSRSVSRVST